MQPRGEFPSVAVAILPFLLAFGLAAGPALAQTTVNATTISGGNWTGTNTSPPPWTCSPTVSPCIPNNSPGDVFDVGINGGYVMLDSSSNLTTVTIDSLSVTSDGSVLEINDGHTLNVIGDVTSSSGDVWVDAGSISLGGSVLNVGGNLTDRVTEVPVGNGNFGIVGGVSIGNIYATSPSTVNVGGSLDNTGGVIFIQGGNGEGGKALLNVNGAPGPLTGFNLLDGITGPAVLNYGSGGITQIGENSTGGLLPDALVLDGAGASVGASGNSELSGLATLTSNGELDVEEGAAVTTTGALANHGQIIMDSGYLVGGPNYASTLSIGGDLTNTYLMAIGNGGTDLTRTVTVDGTLSNAGGLLVVFAGSGMGAHTLLSVAGTFDNTAGQLQLYGGIGTGADAVLNTGGAAPSVLTGDLALYGGTDGAPNPFYVQETAGAVLNYEGGGRITQIGDGSTNSGSLTLIGSKAFVEVGGASGNSALTSLTTIANNGSLYIRNGAVVTTSGNLTNEGILAVGDSVPANGSTLNVGGNLTNSGSTQIGETGQTTQASLNVASNFTNTGTLQVSGALNTNTYTQGPGTTTIGSGGTLTATTSYTQISGATDVNGTLMSPTVNINGGTLSGTGKVQGAVTVASGATLSPGDPGTVDIVGTLDLAGTLTETIDSGSSFDVTDVSGQLTLESSSVLDILLASGFDPSVGTSFAIMDIGSLATGSEFGSILNQTFNGGTEQWDVTYNPTDIVLTAGTVSSTTPEPASLVLFGTGLLLMLVYSLRRRMA